MREYGSAAVIFDVVVRTKFAKNKGCLYFLSFDLAKVREFSFLSPHIGPLYSAKSHH